MINFLSVLLILTETNLQCTHTHTYLVRTIREKACKSIIFWTQLSLSLYLFSLHILFTYCLLSLFHSLPLPLTLILSSSFTHSPTHIQYSSHVNTKSISMFVKQQQQQNHSKYRKSSAGYVFEMVFNFQDE